MNEMVLDVELAVKAVELTFVGISVIMTPSTTEGTIADLLLLVIRSMVEVCEQTHSFGERGVHCTPHPKHLHQLSKHGRASQHVGGSKLC